MTRTKSHCEVVVSHLFRHCEPRLFVWRSNLVRLLRRFAPRKDKRKGPRKKEGPQACYFTREAVPMDYLAYSGEQDIPTGPYSYLQSSLKVGLLHPLPLSGQTKSPLPRLKILSQRTTPESHHKAVVSSPGSFILQRRSPLLFCRPKTTETPQENIRSGLCHALEVRDNLFDGPLEKGNVFCAGIEHCLSINIEVVMG